MQYRQVVNSLGRFQQVNFRLGSIGNRIVNTRPSPNVSPNHSPNPSPNVSSNILPDGLPSNSPKGYIIDKYLTSCMPARLKGSAYVPPQLGTSYTPDGRFFNQNNDRSYTPGSQHDGQKDMGAHGLWDAPKGRETVPAMLEQERNDMSGLPPCIGKTEPMVLDQYDGTTKWEEYRTHFLGVCGWNRWSDKKAAHALRMSLRGEASVFVSRIPGYIHLSLESLSDELQRRFGKPFNKMASKMAVRERKYKMGENVEHFAQDLHSLANEAYSHLGAKVVEEMTFDAFYLAMPGYVQDAIAVANPKTYNNCVALAVRVVSSHNLAPTPVHKITTENGSSSGDVNREASTYQKPASSGTKHYPRPQPKKEDSASQTKSGKSKVKCWKCGAKGHFKNRCHIKGRFRSNNNLRAKVPMITLKDSNSGNRNGKNGTRPPSPDKARSNKTEGNDQNGHDNVDQQGSVPKMNRNVTIKGLWDNSSDKDTIKNALNKERDDLGQNFSIWNFMGLVGIFTLMSIRATAAFNLCNGNLPVSSTSRAHLEKTMG